MAHIESLLHNTYLKIPKKYLKQENNLKNKSSRQFYMKSINAW